MGLGTLDTGKKVQNLSFCLSPPSSGKIITTEVVFGSPGNNCLGHGICMILENSINYFHTCSLTTVLFERLSDDEIKLWVPASLLSEAVRVKHFTGNTFQIEEPVALPGFLCSSLDLHHISCIPAGQYAVSASDLFLQITLPVLHF